MARCIPGKVVMQARNHGLTASLKVKNAVDAGQGLAPGGRDSRQSNGLGMNPRAKLTDNIANQT